MKVLILFAHPAFEKSIVNKRLIGALKPLDGVTVHDLYQEYPHFEIDVAREQDLLLTHDVIVFMHPLFWYGTPAILKQWQDLVLVHGWAYGRDGNQLKGKGFFSIITTGGPLEVYRKNGFQEHTLSEFLLPVTRTARLCQMLPLPLFGVHGTWSIDESEMRAHVTNLTDLLKGLVRENLSFGELKGRAYLNGYYEEGASHA